MSLSGNLGFVPIDEVLRLLTRSHQQGSVDVTGNGLHGRVFVGKGGIDLATTADNDDLHRHLLNSGYSDEKTLSRVTSGETTLAAIGESNTALIDLLREMTVESLYHIADRGEDFRVFEGASTPYASPKTFELEALLHDADERKREWAKVTEVIPNLTTAINFRRDLGDREEVTVKVDDWKVLSEIGIGASVHEIADHLGTTDFWTARIAARLVSNDLVVLRAPTAAPVDEPTYPDEPAFAPAEEVEVPADEYAAYQAERSQEPSESTMPETSEPAPTPLFSVPTEAEEDVDHDESWWREPKDEDQGEAEEVVGDSPTPSVVSEGLSEIPPVGESEDADVEEDTEAFLEKVFSELESDESEAEEGHGLLRRRRMGSLRDFSSDS